PSSVSAPNRTVALASSSPAGAFYADAACGAGTITTVTIAAGTNSATAYYRDTKVGTPAITLTEATLGSATQNQTITPAPVAKLASSPAAQTATAGPCSAIPPVQSRDGFDNPSNAAAAIAVSLTSSSSGGTFYSNPACTAAVTSISIGAGSQTASLY